MHFGSASWVKRLVATCWNTATWKRNWKLMNQEFNCGRISNFFFEETRKKLADVNASTLSSYPFSFPSSVDGNASLHSLLGTVIWSLQSLRVTRADSTTKFHRSECFLSFSLVTTNRTIIFTSRQRQRTTTISSSTALSSFAFVINYRSIVNNTKESS